MSVAHAFHFSPLSIPFLLLSLGLLALIVTAMLVHGDLIIRAAFTAIGLVSLPWAVGTALTLNLTDPALVEYIGRIYLGTISLSSPAMLLVMLALGGQLEQHRALIYIFAFLGLMSCIVAWTTNLVVDGVWQTPWGIWHPTAGPLYPAHIGLVFVALVLGAYVCRHVLLDERSQIYGRQLAIMLVGWTLSASDALLGYEIGVYPFSAFWGSGLLLFIFWAMYKEDILHTRGQPRVIDGGAATELVVIAFIIPLIAVSVWAASPRGLGGGLSIALLLLVPLFGTAQALALMVRSYADPEPGRAISPDADQALERFAEYSLEYRDEVALADELIKLLGRHAELAGIRLYVPAGKGRWRQISAEPNAPQLKVPSDVVRWLCDHRRPLLSQDIYARRIGKLRLSLQALFDVTEGDLVAPLVERGILVGCITASLSADARALEGPELQLLREAVRVTARALTYIGLFREAKERIEIAKELEVATAARHARSPGEERHIYGTCEVIGHYQPAAQYGGDWWVSYQLSDGRVLVVVGDVTGHGVPAALVSSTVASACETARRMLDTDLDVRRLIELLNDAVLGVGAQRYTMSCFAALFDPDAGVVTFANAGYPFPCVCRRSRNHEEDAELHALISRGTHLGTSEPVVSVAAFDIEDDDVVVFYSDSLVESSNPMGERYGERRLQRILRKYARSAGERACEVIIEDALAHYSEQPILDDVTVVVVRMGAGRLSLLGAVDLNPQMGQRAGF